MLVCVHACVLLYLLVPKLAFCQQNEDILASPHRIKGLLKSQDMVLKLRLRLGWDG